MEHTILTSKFKVKIDNNKKDKKNPKNLYDKSVNPYKTYLYSQKGSSKEPLTVLYFNIG